MQKSTKGMVNPHLKRIFAGSSARLSVRKASQMKQARPTTDKAISIVILMVWLMAD